MAQRASSQVARDRREFKTLRDQQYFGSGVVECTAHVAETLGLFAKGGRGEGGGLADAQDFRLSAWGLEPRARGCGASKAPLGHGGM